MTTQRNYYIALTPDGIPLARTFHNLPDVALQRLQDEHDEDWLQLHAAGYRLARFEFNILETYQDANAAQTINQTRPNN